MRAGKRAYNGIHCSDGTRQDSLVIDRKARRASLEVRYEKMKESYTRKRKKTQNLPHPCQ